MHTPGPWICHGNRITHFAPNVAKTVCSLPFRLGINDEWEPTAEQEANARLIATAPDLLQALIELEEEVQRMKALSQEFFDNVDDAAVDRARHAIQEATKP